MPIREFDPQRDIDEAMDIWLSGNMDAHSFIPADHWERTADEAREGMLAAEVLVYEDGPEDGAQGIAGFAELRDGTLEGVFVRKERRGQGVGKQLVDAAKERRDALELEVYIQNPRAFAFLKREGFEQHGVKMDPATFKMAAMMSWAGKPQGFEIPENLEEALAPIRDEAGEGVYRRILDDIRNGNFTE